MTGASRRAESLCAADDRRHMVVRPRVVAASRRLLRLVPRLNSRPTCVTQTVICVTLLEATLLCGDGNARGVANILCCSPLPLRTLHANRTDRRICVTGVFCYILTLYRPVEQQESAGVSRSAVALSSHRGRSPTVSDCAPVAHSALLSRMTVSLLATTHSRPQVPAGCNRLDVCTI